MYNLFSDRTDCRWDIYDHTDLPVGEANAVYNNTKINIEVSGNISFNEIYILKGKNNSKSIVYLSDKPNNVNQVKNFVEQCFAF